MNEFILIVFFIISVIPRLVSINSALANIILPSFLLSVCSLNGLNLYIKNKHVNVLTPVVSARMYEGSYEIIPMYIITYEYIKIPDIYLNGFVMLSNVVSLIKRIIYYAMKKVYNYYLIII